MNWLLMASPFLARYAPLQMNAKGMTMFGHYKTVNVFSALAVYGAYREFKK